MIAAAPAVRSACQLVKVKGQSLISSHLSLRTLPEAAQTTFIHIPWKGDYSQLKLTIKERENPEVFAVMLK